MNVEPEEQAGGKAGAEAPAGLRRQSEKGKKEKEGEEREWKEKREAEFSRRIKMRGEQKLRARQTRNQDMETIWSGLGMIGLIGWGVSVPTLLGAALGIWLDRRFPGEHSWTLTLLFAGLFVGCLNAWRWIVREERLPRGKDGQEVRGQSEREVTAGKDEQGNGK